MRMKRRRLVALAAALCVAGVAWAQDEVPFITTPDEVTLAMLELAAVGPRDHVIDLGSGDGRIVITAARRFGASGLGVEIVPELVQRSRANARTAGVADRVEFREQDLFRTDLARASVITMYLLPAVNLQLRPRLLALAPGTRIVSHDWDMGDWAPERTVVIDVPDKPIGREKQSRVHLWIVPAQVQGLWCAGRVRLEITQRFQQFSATLSEGDAPAPLLVFDGRIAGRELVGGAQGEMRLLATDEGVRLERSGLPGAAHVGRLFSRAGLRSCD
jgi:SAM-dependent methyltransferase